MEEPNDTIQDTTPSISSELGTQKNLGNKNRDLGLEIDASWLNDSPSNEFDDDEEKSENKGGAISQFRLGIIYLPQELRFFIFSIRMGKKNSI